LGYIIVNVQLLSVGLLSVGLSVGRPGLDPSTLCSYGFVKSK